MFRVVLAVVFLVSACGRIPNDWRERIPDSHFGPTATTEIACNAVGGQWLEYGLAPFPRCKIPTTDGGKACDHYTDCEGLCVTATTVSRGDKVEGVCANLYSGAECRQPVYRGRADYEVCE
jgi:hypothetical protein